MYKEQQPQSNRNSHGSQNMKNHHKTYSNNPLLNVNKQSVDIMSLMTNRLTLTEFKNKELSSDLSLKNRMINELQQELAQMQTLKDENRQLKDDNQRLLKQVEEMQEFLKQYGVSWQDKQGTLDVNGILQELKEKPLFNYSVPQQLDISILSQRITELNSMLKKEGQLIYKDSQNIHRMRNHDQIDIHFYADGLVIDGFGFMDYEAQKGQQVLADILEGYFPGIIKEQYPEGVIINIRQSLDQQHSIQLTNVCSQQTDDQQTGCQQTNNEEQEIGEYQIDDEYKTVIKVRVAWNSKVFLVNVNKQQKVTELFQILDRYEQGQKLVQQYPKIEVNRECQLSLLELGWWPKVALILQR